MYLASFLVDMVYKKESDVRDLEKSEIPID